MRQAPVESHGRRSILVPVKPGPPPAFLAVSSDAADPAGVSAADPIPFAFKGTAPRPDFSPRLPAFVFAGSGAGPAVRRARGPARGWVAEATGKRTPFFPVPAILRWRFSQGARVASSAALGAGVAAVAEGDGCLGPRAPPPGTAKAARG